MERFKLWGSRDKRQRSDRLGVRVSLCVGLRLLNSDESLFCGATYFFWRVLHLYLCTSVAAGSCLRSVTHPPLQGDRSLASFALLFSKLRLLALSVSYLWPYYPAAPLAILMSLCSTSPLPTFPCSAHRLLTHHVYCSYIL